ncbi:MAG: alpha/beta hydrolase, partial [Chloroflexi bacterium]
MFIWQIEEYSSVLPLLARRFRANQTDATLRVTKASFGSSPNQHVLLCCPTRPELRRDTCIFFIHGGGWQHGAPAWFRFVGHFFAKLGFPTLLTGYRLAPAHRFPAQLEDVDTGLCTGIAMLRNEGVPVNNIIFGGQSAGAHLASLLAFDPDTGVVPYLQRESIALKGLLLVGGPLDFSHCGSRRIRKYIGDLMGNTSNWDQADPIHYIRGDETLPV